VPNDNLGIFRVNATADPETGGYIDGFDLLFDPFLNVWNEDGPIATITYRVFDPDGAYSQQYTVSILSGFVPFNITYKNDTTLTTDEDIELLFQVDRYGIDYFGGNEGMTDVDLTISNVQKAFTGTLGYCVDGAACVPITAATTAIPDGARIRYLGGPDLFGDTALTFDLTLTPHTGAPSITVTYTINVNPVNDPPVLIARNEPTDTSILLFNTTASGLENACDEDTYIIINFNVTDIDDLPSTLNGDLVQFLYQGAPGTYYHCQTDVIEHGDCHRGDPLGEETFLPLLSDATHASFRFVFVPDPNANGVARLLLQATDPHYGTSSREIVEITVRPINDPPDFVTANATLGTVSGTGRDKWTIISEVFDIDFFFGYTVNVTYTLHEASSTPYTNATVAKREIGQSTTDEPVEKLGWFVMPQSTAAGGSPPCILADDNLSITCQDLIEDVNGWLKAGITLEFDERVVGRIIVELNVNDLGNIDYRVPPPPLNTSVLLIDHLEGDNLAAATKPAGNNIALIAAPIAGLLAGALIAGLIFAIRKNQAKAAVENYFDRFALGMEGATNTSPLYEGATKGGESPIYKGSS
jgi:hypothetical protein